MTLIRRASSSLPQAFGYAKRSFKSLRIHGESLDFSSSPNLIHVFHCPVRSIIRLVADKTQKRKENLNFHNLLAIFYAFLGKQWRPDEVGIVAKLLDCIASRGGNILGADVFVPKNKNVFYSRSEFVFDPFKWPREQMNEDFLKIAEKLNAVKSVVRVPDIDPKYKIALLASKQEHCLVDMLHAWQDGKLPVDITCVISNHERAPNTHVIRFLERHGILYHYLRTTKENKREEEILELVQDTDFLLLASYGRDVINIHHGLLPSFKGGNPSRQAFDAGVKLIGATSHFVTEELDSGPIIEPMVERVSHRDNLRSFVQKSEKLRKNALQRL